MNSLQPIRVFQTSALIRCLKWWQNMSGKKWQLQKRFSSISTKIRDRDGSWCRHYFGSETRDLGGGGGDRAAAWWKGWVGVGNDQAAWGHRVEMRPRCIFGFRFETKKSFGIDFSPEWLGTKKVSVSCSRSECCRCCHLQTFVASEASKEVS